MSLSSFTKLALFWKNKKQYPRINDKFVKLKNLGKEFFKASNYKVNIIELKDLH